MNAWWNKSQTVVVYRGHSPGKERDPWKQCRRCFTRIFCKLKIERQERCEMSVKKSNAVWGYSHTSLCFSVLRTVHMTWEDRDIKTLNNADFADFLSYRSFGFLFESSFPPICVQWLYNRERESILLSTGMDTVTHLLASSCSWRQFHTGRVCGQKFHVVVLARNFQWRS